MDVYIIGAGIVGLSLARELAENGINATVYESKATPEEGADKASGILSISGIKRAGIDISNAVINELDGAIIRAGNQELNVRARTSQAYVLDRKVLAVNAYRNAVKSGAKVILKKRINREELIELGKSNLIVGADGAISTVASTFNFPEIKDYILTYKAIFSVPQFENTHQVIMEFSKATPGFFGWIVPYGNKRIEVGVGVNSRNKKTSSRAFDEFTKSELVQKIIDGAKKESGAASIIPISARSITAKKNIALVGDAAGQVKATTGGGIIFGTECARLLARTIEKGLDNEHMLERYDKEWRKFYGRDLTMHKHIYGYYANADTKKLERLLKFAKLFGMESFLSKYGDMDRPSIMLKRFILRGLSN
ncbi:MAG: FAD-dependent oxidoreductase [Candidatus Micrarchaeia archaeon]